MGRKVENAIALELVRSGTTPQFYKNKHEIDFIIKDGLNLKSINVCFADEVPERETEGLKEFANKHKNVTSILLDKKKSIDYVENKIEL